MKDNYPHTLEELRRQQQAIREKHRGVTVTEVPKAYAERLEKSKKIDNSVGGMLRRAGSAVARPQKEVKQSVDYEAARQLTWAIMKATLQQRGKNVTIDQYNRGVIVQMVKWFIGDPTCELELQKGILLTGPVGTGKTYLFSTMQALSISAMIETRQFRMARCVDVAELVRSQNADQKTASKAAARLEKMHHGHWCFDDLGHEPNSVKVWGDDRYVMEPILSRRYNAFIAGDCITHATTNLSKERLREFYGDRIADRFTEMFNIVLLDGQSRRK